MRDRVGQHTSSVAGPDTLSVAIHQPGLPWYRVGLFDRMATSVPCRLTVFHDVSRPNAKEADPTSSFTAVSIRDCHLAGGRLIWSRAQVAMAFSKTFGCIVLSWNSRYLSLPVALLVARLRRTPVLLWGHGYSKQDSVVRRFYRLLLGALSSRMIFYSSAQVSELPHFLARRSMGVGNALFRDQVPLPSLRSPRAKGDRRINVIHVGQLRPDRGLEVVFESLALLRSHHWDARLTIVGDGPHRPRLEALSRLLGLTMAVDFVGAVYPPQLRSYLNSADVATFGCHGGLGVLDALEHGLPVVLCGSRSSHPPEANLVFEHLPDLVDGTCSPEGVARALRTAAQDPSMAQRVGNVIPVIEAERLGMITLFTDVIRSTSRYS
jgi:glycosyltransferase involved in cell wall biosynthesis